jgi:hypothetical protein
VLYRCSYTVRKSRLQIPFVDETLLPMSVLSHCNAQHIIDLYTLQLLTLQLHVPAAQLQPSLQLRVPAAQLQPSVLYYCPTRHRSGMQSVLLLAYCLTTHCRASAFTTTTDKHVRRIAVLQVQPYAA